MTNLLGSLILGYTLQQAVDSAAAERAVQELVNSVPQQKMKSEGKKPVHLGVPPGEKSIRRLTYPGAQRARMVQQIDGWVGIAAISASHLNSSGEFCGTALNSSL